MKAQALLLGSYKTTNCYDNQFDTVKAPLQRHFKTSGFLINIEKTDPISSINFCVLIKVSIGFFVVAPPHVRLNNSRAKSLSLYHPWSQNYLGQMLTARVLSKHLISTSTTFTPNIPWSTRCVRHCEMVWLLVYLVVRQSQFENEARRYFCIDAQRRFMPEFRRLSLI